MAKEEIPPLNFSAPSHLKQFFTYSIRNLLSKIADRQYVMLALLISPVLAFIVSIFSKYFSPDSTGNPIYIFGNNLNLPAYLFMSVIVSLFIGLIISAEEILKDRKTLEREKFLNLSKVSYFNSKLLFLFILSAFQILVYVKLGNYMLEIKGMALNYWLVLFSTSCFAVMLGLNISSTFKTAVSIYINVPFILVPLILLAGVIVRYDKLHYRLSSMEHVPIAGDIMASRWAYEALVVTQFKDNKYQKHFYPVDRELANISWKVNFLIPELTNKMNDYEWLLSQNKDPERRNEIEALVQRSITDNFTYGTVNIPDLTLDNPMNSLNITAVRSLLNSWRSNLIEENKNHISQKDRIFEDFRKLGMTNKDIAAFKETYFNKSIADLVLNTDEMTKIIEYKGKLIRKDTPVYQTPASRIGRAQFYSANKKIGSWIIDTLWFNISILWLMTLFLYFTLVNDVFRRIIRYMQGIHTLR